MTSPNIADLKAAFFGGGTDEEYQWLLDAQANGLTAQSLLDGSAYSGAFGAWGKPRIKFYGHSYIEGKTGPSKRTNRLSTQITALLDGREENYGMHGASTTYTGIGPVPWMTSTPPRVPPFDPACQAALIYTGINDFGGNLTTTPNLTTNWIRAQIHWLRAAQRMTVQDSSYITVAQGAGASNWQQTALAYGPSGDWWKGVSGNTWTITTPDSFPGGSVRIWVLVQNNNGAVHTVTLNGSAAVVEDTRSLNATSSVMPVCIEIPDVPAGENTIVDTLSDVASSGEQFVVCEWAAENPPPVVVCNINKAPSYAANGGVATDGGVDAQNALIEAMVAEFTDGRVVLLDVDALLNKDADYFAGDGLHLNDSGNTAVAAAAAAVFRPLLFPTAADFAATKAQGPESLQRVRVDTSSKTAGAVSNASAGIATLTAGTVTVTTRALESSSDLILLTRQSGASTGTLSVTAKTPGSGATSSTFVITSSDNTDTGTVGWFIINAAG